MEFWILLGLVALIFMVYIAVYALVFLYCILRMIFDKDFRQKTKEEAEARQKYYTPKNKRRYPTEKMYKNYYRTGDRNYLWKEDYKGH